MSRAVGRPGKRRTVRERCTDSGKTQTPICVLAARRSWNLGDVSSSLKAGVAEEARTGGLVTTVFSRDDARIGRRDQYISQCDIMQRIVGRRPFDGLPFFELVCLRLRQSETCYSLGDGYFHYGMSAGLEDPLRLAAEAFQRGWAIDSAAAGNSRGAGGAPVLAEPLSHMVEIAQLRGNTGEARRIVARALATDTAATSRGYLRWNLAILLGNSARPAFWARSQGMESGSEPRRGSPGRDAR
jgi:hypothetical protein